MDPEAAKRVKREQRKAARKASRAAKKAEAKAAAKAGVAGNGSGSGSGSDSDSGGSDSDSDSDSDGGSGSGSDDDVREKDTQFAEGQELRRFDTKVTSRRLARARALPVFSPRPDCSTGALHAALCS